MGLDLSAVSRQIRSMTQSAAGSSGERSARRALVRQRYLHAAHEPAKWAEAAEISREKSAFLLARPTDEPLDFVRAAPRRPAAYTIVATDGSQIELDRHGSIDCYLINIGRVFLRYGIEPTARLDSQPQLAYRDEELYISDGARRISIEGNYLSARRDVEEGVALAALAKEHCDGTMPSLALQDGTLVRWALAGAERVIQEAFLDRYLAYLREMQAMGVPTASYISRPRSPEVAGIVRLMLCPDLDLASQRPAHCAQCSDLRAGRQPSCAPASDITDAELLAEQLAEGERGPLFASLSRINVEAYGEQQIHFFYLRVGSEIGRVEIPAWVASDPAQVDLVHGLVYDQCMRGDGYPVALARAHEQAVVRSADRRAFERIVAGSLYQAGASSGESRKRESKAFSRS